MAITDRIYVKNHRQVQAQLDVRFARAAFSGSTLDALYAGKIDQLDDATRAKVVAFAEDFLDCACESNPYCGHPERKFIQYLLELRAAGFEPETMVDVMTDDYGVVAFPGDVLSFLDEAVRALDAIEAIAAVTGENEMVDRARAVRGALV